MELMLAIGLGIVTACGVYLLLRGRTFPVVLGLSLLSYGANLFIFSMGRLGSGAPPHRHAGGGRLCRSITAGAGVDCDRHQFWDDRSHHGALGADVA